MSLLWKAASAGQITIQHIPETHGGRLIAHHPDEGPVGYLNYVSSDQGVGIDMVHTKPAHRRQGIASALTDRLREMHPGHQIVTEDFSPLGERWQRGYARSRGVQIRALSPGEWWGEGQQRTASAQPQWGDPGVMSWDEVQEKHPTYDVRPVEGQTDKWGEYSGPNEDHGWAVSELAHGDGSFDEGEGMESEHDLPFTEESVPVHEIRHEFHPADDPRVQRAMQGYRRFQQVPPPLLVKRAGEYHVADGHHRVSAARHLGLTHLPAIVAHSPREDRLEY